MEANTRNRNTRQGKRKGTHESESEVHYQTIIKGVEVSKEIYHSKYFVV